MHYIYGSISHGTLRTENLLRAFADTLETLLAREGHPGNTATLTELIESARAVKADLAEEDNSDETALYAGEILSELEMVLDDYAPPGHYFGPHTGDGADFGFWKCEE